MIFFSVKNGYIRRSKLTWDEPTDGPTSYTVKSDPEKRISQKFDSCEADLWNDARAEELTHLLGKMREYI